MLYVCKPLYVTVSVTVKLIKLSSPHFSAILLLQYEIILFYFSCLYFLFFCFFAIFTVKLNALLAANDLVI